MARHEKMMPAVARTSMRPGAAIAVDITRRSVQQTDGTSLVEIELDMTMAAVPDRRYVADVASLDLTASGVRLMFGQTKITSQADLRTLLAISLQPKTILKFLEGSNEFE